MRLQWLSIFAIDAWLIYDDTIAMAQLQAFGGPGAWLSLSLIVLAAFGTFAYAINFKILDARFWLVSSLVIGVGCLWVLLQMIFSEITRIQTGAAPVLELVVGGTVISVFLLAQCYAVFRYSRSLRHAP